MLKNLRRARSPGKMSREEVKNMSNGNDLRELDKRLDILEAGPEEQKMNDFVEPTVDQPSLADLMEWDERGGCEATDGCWVEPDGGCEHGHVSWLVYLGLI